MIPKDPAILLSFLNMKLRDRYGSLKDLCEDLDEPEEDLLKTLREAGLSYDPETNQVR